jgi:hypothetical protein
MFVSDERPPQAGQVSDARTIGSQAQVQGLAARRALSGTDYLRIFFAAFFFAGFFTGLFGAW